MGVGDYELGKKLLVTFLSKLADSEVAIDHVACVNSGIFLTTEECPALESIGKIAAKGARIATCGTCLKHFARKDRLLIGEVGTMDETLELLTSADRVIRI